MLAAYIARPRDRLRQSPRMSTPEPQGFAARWIAAWNARDVDSVLSDYADDVVFTSPTAARFFHPDYVDHEPSHPELPTGPESVVTTVHGLHRAFGDLRFEIEDEIADGDKVVQLVTMKGRQVGTLMGREPTGRAFAVRHIYVWRIAGGTIIEHWGSRNDLGLLQQ